MSKLFASLFGSDEPTPSRDRLIAGSQKRRIVIIGCIVLALIIVTSLIVVASLPPRDARSGNDVMTSSLFQGSTTDVAMATTSPSPQSAASTSTSSSTPTSTASSESRFWAKNLIFMLSDGMGPASMPLARVVGERARLALDDALVGTSRTFSSDSLVTDSAAGATAYACASKSYNGAIAVDDARRPLATVLEVARQRGMPVGLVVTSRVTHATPASFSAHATFRDYEQFIASQQANLTLDVMLGGGRNQFTRRSDGRNLLTELAGRGVTVFGDVTEFRAFARDVGNKNLANVKVAGLFADDHMSYNVDRDPSVEPSLAEMTQLALDILHAKSGDKGFFLLVEGSRIDMAAHDNDPSTQVGETLAYDDAFAVVRDFVDKRSNRTLVVASSDHETGGLSLGRRDDPLGGTVTYAWYPEKLRHPKRSAWATARAIMQPLANASTLIRDYLGNDVTDAEIQRYLDLRSVVGGQRLIMLNLGNELARRALLGWSTTGHSGVDVNLYTWNDQGLPADVLARNNLSEVRGKLGGNLDNTAIGRYMILALNLLDDLAPYSRILNSTLDFSTSAAHQKRATADEHHQ
jgi:alkaline phosphatase